MLHDHPSSASDLRQARWLQALSTLLWATAASSNELFYIKEDHLTRLGLCGGEELLPPAPAQGEPFSFVFKEDVPGLCAAVQGLLKPGDAFVRLCRCHGKDGGCRWLELRGAASEGRDDGLFINAAALDMTNQKQAEDKLRISEEQFRVAAASGGWQMARYDIKTSRYYHENAVLLSLGFPEIIDNVPAAFLERGAIAAECVPAYSDFYDQLRSGAKTASLDVAIQLANGGYRWFRGDATVIFDGENTPSQAIIMVSDITEQRDKEAIYKKWQQSLRQKNDQTYTLFRCNLSKDASLDAVEGSLLTVSFSPEASTFNARTTEYASQYVCESDRANYIAVLNSGALLAAYYQNRRNKTLEYRELLADGAYRWLRLSIELVEFPSSSDVEAYLMYEDINDAKLAELQARELAETDALTGILNRAAFAKQMNAVLQNERSAQHTLMLLDIDNFKQVNDTFGHAAGDQTLIDTARSIRAILRQGDLLGRLGGDEFVICLKAVPYQAIIEKKAAQICALMRKVFSQNVMISASIGVAQYPKDGETFDALYRNADTALYAVKGKTKNGYALYNEGMADSAKSLIHPPAAAPTEPPRKRRMLIVDDNAINLRILTNIFKDAFTIQTVTSGSAALIHLRHFGAGVAVVLLDLVMPGIDGFAVLKEMQQSTVLCTIPVVVVSGETQRGSALKAIKSGASDYVFKPIDPDLIRLRVQSVISKAENEHLRAQNSYLLLQGNEEAKYRIVLEATGTVVVECDWTNQVFIYDPAISRYLAGRYDGRSLWHILLSDMVAEAMDVKALQELVYDLANGRRGLSGTLTLKLKTPDGQRRWFRVNAFKRMDDYQTTNRIILTFNDVNEETEITEKLRYRVERDEITGLYNRQTFLDKAESAIGQKPANTWLLAVGDVDGFRRVNERYGREEGNQLLHYLAEAVTVKVRQRNGLCGRLESDIFAALLPNEASVIEAAAASAKTLLLYYFAELELTCSVGFYQVQDPALPINDMLNKAVIAQKSVKSKNDTKAALYHNAMLKTAAGRKEGSCR